MGRLLGRVLCAGLMGAVTWWFLQQIKPPEWTGDEWPIWAVSGFFVLWGWALYGNDTRWRPINPEEGPLKTRMRGFLANLLLLAAVLLVVHLVIALWSPWAWKASRGYPQWIRTAGQVGVPMFVLIGLANNWNWLKEKVGDIGMPIIWASRRMGFGQGGSGGYQGLIADWAFRYKPGAILLGKSRYHSSWWVGIKDDRHCLTISGTGGGKDRSVVLPNLLSGWPGSYLVIDPKGTAAAVTGEWRGEWRGLKGRGIHGLVYCINPFRVNEGREGMPPPSRFNPLDMVDLDGPTVFEDIDLIADALVIVPAHGDPHWGLSAKSLIRGIIYLVKSEHGDDANLGMVRDVLTDPDGLPLAKMVQAGGVAKQAAAQLMAASDKELGSIISSTIQQTDWLASDAMREALSASDFDLMSLKRYKTTLYLVVPLEFVETHARFLRLFVNLAVKCASRMPRGVPLRIFLNEFYSLGPMPALLKASANIRSYGVSLWPIIQNIAQLKEHYPANWQTFIANSATVQFFAVNDTETLQYAASRLGQRRLYAKGPGGTQQVGRAPLRTADELAIEIGRDSENMLVLFEGKFPMLLRKLKYDQDFDREAYNLDPDYA